MKTRQHQSRNTIILQPGTARRFTACCRKLGASHSESLEIILNFFEQNRNPAKKNPGADLKGLENNLRKKIDEIAIIIRTIEKKEIKPILAMMQLLFQENPGQEEDLLIEKNLHQEDLPQDESLRQIILQEQVEQLEQQNNGYRSDLLTLLSQIRVTRSSYGEEQFQLTISRQELDLLRTKMESA